MPGTVTAARTRVAPSIMKKAEQVAPLNRYFCRAMARASEQLLFSYMPGDRVESANASAR